MQQTGLLPKEFYNGNIGYSEPLVQTSIVRYQTPEGVEEKRTLDINRIPSYVKRFYKGGDFLLFSKASPFFEFWKQGRRMHQRLGVQEFKAFIQKLAEEQTLRDA